MYGFVAKYYYLQCISKRKQKSLSTIKAMRLQ
jgi:hypothetical protein